MPNLWAVVPQRVAVPTLYLAVAAGAGFLAGEIFGVTLGVTVLVAINGGRSPIELGRSDNSPKYCG